MVEMNIRFTGLAKECLASVLAHLLPLGDATWLPASLMTAVCVLGLVFALIMFRRFPGKRQIS